jgi:hypothetical protein
MLQTDLMGMRSEAGSCRMVDARLRYVDDMQQWQGIHWENYCAIRVSTSTVRDLRTCVLIRANQGKVKEANAVCIASMSSMSAP